jgi:hypothetical protein
MIHNTQYKEPIFRIYMMEVLEIPWHIYIFQYQEVKVVKQMKKHPSNTQRRRDKEER